MGRTRRQILRRHDETLSGRLRARIARSTVLDTRKPYYLYEAPGLANATAAPLLLLLRGHEREWVNMKEDDSRRRSTAIEDVDRLVAEGALPPLLAVMPGLNSSDNHVPSLGIDMVGTWPGYRYSLGTGRFWTYLTEELLPNVAAGYPAVTGPRVAVGFSLGGYTASLLALHQPEALDHVAIYDGLFMWPRHNDPRENGAAFSDPVWCEASIFDAALGRPRDRDALRRWNPTDRLQNGPSTLLRPLRDTTFWIGCAAGDGNRGNRDRARFFTKLLRRQDVPVGLDRVVFDDEARHTWHWADRFLQYVLAQALPEPTTV